MASSNEHPPIPSENSDNVTAEVVKEYRARLRREEETLLADPEIQSKISHGKAWDDAFAAATAASAPIDKEIESLIRAHPQGHPPDSEIAESFRALQWKRADVRRRAFLSMGFIEPKATTPHVLKTSFDRFFETLESTTVPAGGGRRVLGVPHAVALSEATADLFVEIVAAGRTIADQFGVVASELPPGLGLEHSDSPNGPWEHVPEENMVIRAIHIGGEGAPAALMAALESASEVAAYSAARWNHLQAERPGGPHQRWRAGDVVTQAHIEVLRSTQGLLKLWKPLPTTITEPDGRRPKVSIVRVLAAKLPDATMPSASKASGGRTQAELLRAAETSETVFRELVRASGIMKTPHGKKGRIFTPSEIRQLIDTAIASNKQARGTIERAWEPFATPRSPAA